MSNSDHRWKRGKAANTDRKVTLMRSAKTKATYGYGMGGLPKGDVHKPRPVTLSRMPWDSKDGKNE
jgi:hypothetical protein